jgi:hypothetical protein
MSALVPEYVITDWKPIHKGKLVGKVEVTPNGRLSIGECLVLLSNPGPFVVLPRRPKIDRDDHIMRDGNSKIIYERDLKWLGRDIAKQWSEGVLAALLEKYPDALNGESR